jgi:hypothetical protein
MINILVARNKGPYWTTQVPWLYLIGLCLSFCAVARGQQTVTLGWDPESDPAVVGYVLYYGTASLQYTVRQDVGTNTMIAISSLALGSNYFFAVTSYNSEGLESTPTPEVSVSLPPSLFFANQTNVPGLNVVVPGSTNTTTDYLQFPDGVPFGYYTLVAYPWFYHHDLGYEYLFEANDGAQGVYFYDLNSQSFWYTNPSIYPILYDFSLNDWIYYYPNKSDPGHYTSDPRYFYNYATKQVISK